MDAAALAAQPVRAQVKFEILESADLLAHLEDPPTQKAESGSDLTIDAVTHNLQEFFSFSPLPRCQSALYAYLHENDKVNHENRKVNRRHPIKEECYEQEEFRDGSRFQLCDHPFFSDGGDGHETLYTTTQLRDLCGCAYCVKEPEKPITGG